MLDTWHPSLHSGRPLILDGGTGTELRRRGVPLDPVVWSGRAPLEHHAQLRAVHADYVAAGADVLTTCTFGTNRFLLAARSLESELATVTRHAVAAAREAARDASRDVRILGALSCLPPAFDTTRYPPPEVEEAAYRELATLLASEGVDALLLEMMEETVHAPRAFAAARSSGIPVWLGVSCRLRDGALVAYDFPDVTLDRCLDALLPLAPDALIVMHSPPEAITPALERIRQRYPGPLGAAPELGDGSTPPTLAPEALASLARDWLGLGARILGGCCGTTPSHVHALAALVR